MRYAVLAHRGDADAEPLARELARRPADVVLLWEDDLFLGSRFTHRLGPRGCETELACEDGRRLDSTGLNGVVCRLTHAAPPQFAAAAAADRDYAGAEAAALLLSWLSGLACPVVNPASPRGLSGPVLSRLEWSLLAARAGLGCSFRVEPGADPEEPASVDPIDGPARELLVVGPNVLGEASPELARSCVELARTAGCPVLGIAVAGSVSAGPRQTRFLAARTLPPLGAAGAAAVAELLAGGGG